MSGNLFYLGIISFALGVALASLVVLNVFSVFFGMLLIGVFFIYGIFLKINSSPQYRTILILSCVGALFIMGIVRVYMSNDVDQSRVRHVGERVVFEGIVIDEPDQRENNTRLIIKPSQFIFPDTIHFSSSVLVVTDIYPEYMYGDKVRVSGMLEQPQNFTNDLGREFNYKAFLAKDGIYHQIFKPTLELISQDEGNLIKEKIFTFKKAFLTHIEQAVPEPASSLAGGLLLGVKQSLGKEILDDFRTVGLIHIVVLSGYNITIVAESFMKIFAFLFRRRLASVFGLLSIVLFAVMTGAGATVVRASIMASLVFVARFAGRNFDALRALFIAGFVMLLHNPKILMHDPSFQLSFTATLGLILVSPLILKYLSFIPERFGFRELASATVATQIFILPLLLFMMGELSLVALPVNLLVLVSIPTAMLLSFLAGSLGFVSFFISLPFGFLAYIVLAYIFKIVELFSQFPFASVKISYFPLWLMALMYVMYGYILWNINKKQAGSPVGDPAYPNS